MLGPEVDRSLALTDLNGEERPDQGGPTIGRVLEDLRQLPFLTDHRVVLVRAADPFISANRETLERYVADASSTATLVLECSKFPATTRLAKAAKAAKGVLQECKLPSLSSLPELVTSFASERNKRISAAAASMLVDLVGQDPGSLANEVEKLSLYIGERAEITPEDVSVLVGQSREEKIFAVMDQAALGRLPQALDLWHQTIASDPGARFKVVGGMAFVLRRWLDAHRQRAEGVPLRSLAGKLFMWGRQNEVERLLELQTPTRLRQALAAVADLDTQAKSGSRSIETGVEILLARLARRRTSA